MHKPTFKLDENIPFEAAEYSQELGYDAVTVAQQGLRGRKDPVIAQICREEGRVILTIDLDFADVRKFPPSLYRGIIVMRFSKQGFKSIMDSMKRILRYLEHEPLEGHLWIITEKRLRIRSGLDGNGHEPS